MDDNRSAFVNIGGEEYEMLLTTRATREIGKKYGGLSNLGEKLFSAENFELALSEIIWLIVLLVNQPILIHNIKNKDNPKELLTEEDVEILTSPSDLATFRDAITTAMQKGTARNVKSETEPGNPTAG
jgi:hypothetical protein